MTTETATAPVRVIDIPAAASAAAATADALRPRKPSRWRWALVIFTLGAVALTGCASGGTPSIDGDAGQRSSKLYERTIDLTDGRTVTCIIRSSGYAGGISCDWDGAER